MPPRTELAVCLLAAWFFGLLLATPLYTPYPRLTLPWLIAAWLATGALLAWWVEARGPLRELMQVTPISRRTPGDLLTALGFDLTWLAAVVFLVSLVAFGEVKGTNQRIPAWQDRTGLERIAADIAARVDPERGVVLVYSEPALYFHLRTEGVAAVPIGGLDFGRPEASSESIDVYLVAGPHAHREEDFTRNWPGEAHRFDLVAEWNVAAGPLRLSDLALLDSYSPDEFSDLARQEELSFRLYRFRTPAP
ncbi:MAG: hypothetical protein ACREIV_15240 [Planctomycetaceae bacterium]